MPLGADVAGFGSDAAGGRCRHRGRDGREALRAVQPPLLPRGRRGAAEGRVEKDRGRWWIVCRELSTLNRADLIPGPAVVVGDRRVDVDVVAGSAAWLRCRRIRRSGEGGPPRGRVRRRLGSAAGLRGR